MTTRADRFTIGRVITALALAGFAVASIGTGLDRASDGDRGWSELIPAPFRSRADAVAANAALARQDADAVIDYAAKAVRSAPLDADAIALLATGYAIAGRDDDADAAFRAAAGMGWRNPLTQFYWIDESFVAGRPDLAAARADALLRGDPSRQDAGAILGQFETGEDRQAALAERLAERPNWSIEFLSPGDLPPESLSARAAVLASDAIGAEPLGCGAVARLASAVAMRVGPDQAEAILGRHCPGAESLNGLRDSQFASLDTPNRESPLGWQRVESGSVSASRSMRGGSTAIALTNYTPTPRPVLRQAVWLEPGEVSFSWAVVEGRKDRFAVSLDCGKPARPVVRTQAEPVPVPPCAMQHISLWVWPGDGPVVVSGLSLET